MPTFENDLAAPGHGDFAPVGVPGYVGRSSHGVSETQSHPAESLGWKQEDALISEGGLPPNAGLQPGGGQDNLTMHFGAGYGLLAQRRPDVATLATFAHRIEVATFHMFVAFHEGGVRDFDLGNEEAGRLLAKRPDWFGMLADTTFFRFRILRRALMHVWTPPASVVPLTYSVFFNLCELTPAGASLKVLFLRRKDRAIERLVGQLDLLVKQLEDTVDLANDADIVTDEAAAEDAASEDSARLEANQTAALEKAGDHLGLTEAAATLGMSRQNLHKRIQAGSALGLMRGREVAIPTIQFVQQAGQTKIVPGLRQVLAVFDEATAGKWSALQFLTEVDGMLGSRPIDRLKEGDIDVVVAAARAFLGLDAS